MRLFIKRIFLLCAITVKASQLIVDRVPIVNSVVTPSPAAAPDLVRLITVYLPKAAFQDPEKRFPVIYYLPGLGGNNTTFTVGNKAIMDDLIDSGQALEMIIVHVDPSVANGIDTDGKRRYQGTWYVNSLLNGNFEDFMVNDLIPFVDAHYPTIPSAAFRGIVGQSMGGFGSMYHGIKYPNLYCAFGQASGTTFFVLADDTVSFAPDQPAPGKEMFVLNSLLIPGIPTSGPNAGKITPDNDALAFSVFSYAGAFSPNLNNPPYFVDLPFEVDVNGYPIFVDGPFFTHDVTTGQQINTGKSLVPRPDVIALWMANDPIYYIPTQKPLLEDSWVYHDGGNSELINAVGARFFAQTMSQAGLFSEYILYSGGQGGHTDCLTTPFCSRHRTMFQLMSARFAKSLYPPLQKSVLKGTWSIILKDNSSFVLNDGSQLAVESDAILDTNVSVTLNNEAQLLIGSDTDNANAVFQIGNAIHKFDLLSTDYNQPLSINCAFVLNDNASFVLSKKSVWGIGAGVVTRATDNRNYSVIESLSELSNFNFIVNSGLLSATSITPNGLNLGSLVLIGNVENATMIINSASGRVQGGSALMYCADNLARHPVIINQVGDQSAGGIRNAQDTRQGLLDYFLQQPISSQLAYSNLIKTGIFTSKDQLSANISVVTPFQLINVSSDDFYQFLVLNQTDEYDQQEVTSKFATVSVVDDQIVLTYIVDNGFIVRVPQDLIPISHNRISELKAVAKTNGTVLIQLALINGNRVLVGVDF